MKTHNIFTLPQEAFKFTDHAMRVLPRSYSHGPLRPVWILPFEQLRVSRIAGNYFHLPEERLRPNFQWNGKFVPKPNEGCSNRNQSSLQPECFWRQGGNGSLHKNVLHDGFLYE